MDEALQTEKLYVRRGRFMVCDVNLCLENGQMLAVSGKSGAGKSTLIHGIGGAIRPEAGRITYWGREMYQDEIGIRRNMSVMYDTPNFNLELKPRRLVKEIMKFEPWFDREKFEVYMQQMELDSNMRVKLYSLDMQKKLMLILALCRNPRLLVMDEPTNGVDALSRQLMWEMIADYRKEQELSVLYTTNDEAELERADAVVSMKNGVCMLTEEGAEKKETKKEHEAFL